MQETSARKSPPVRMLAYVLAYVGSIFTAPFRADPESVASLSVDERERLRRARLLRLILVVVILSIVGLAYPAGIARHAPLANLWVVGGIAALALVCLLFNAVRQTSLAALIFVLGGLALGIGFALDRPNGTDALGLIGYGSLFIFILVGGLILPGLLLWATTAIAMGATFAGLLLVPPAPHLSEATGEANILTGLAFQIASIQLLTAILTQVYARSASASIQAASRAFERERELTELKDQFIIDANHELRSPIMALYGNLELLATLGDRADPEQRSRLFGRALRSGETVLRLLGSVLDVGALGAGPPRVSLAPVTLAPLVTDVLETFDPREIGEPQLESDTMQPRAVTVHVAAGLRVMADEGRLRQVLINLLSNALKYSAAGTPIAITAELMPPERRHDLGRRGGSGHAPTQEVRVSVRDQGLGVPPADVHKLFSRFVRLERDIAGPVRGTGVGLYLCRALVTAMGGHIWVESSGVPGEGSTFRFTLPLAEPQTASDQPSN